MEMYDFQMDKIDSFAIFVRHLPTQCYANSWPSPRVLSGSFSIARRQPCVIVVAAR